MAIEVTCRSVLKNRRECQRSPTPTVVDEKLTSTSIRMIAYKTHKQGSLYFAIYTIIPGPPWTVWFSVVVTYLTQLKLLKKSR